MGKSKRKSPDFETAAEFEALTDAQKEQVYREIDREHPNDRLSRSTSLTPADRARHRKFLRKGHSPKGGKNHIKVISLGVEEELLRRADGYAKKKGLKRAQFINEAIRQVLGIAS
jgi:hypothetical protein